MSREVALVGKSDLAGDFADRVFSNRQHPLCALDSAMDYVLMRGEAGRELELPAEVRRA
jgi:hypothetical protein